MRARGATLRTIARELNVALGSVSTWVRDVPTVRGILEGVGARRAIAFRGNRLPVWTPGGVRVCYRCQRLLPDAAFARSRGGRQYRCRRCCRDYFLERGDLHREQSGAALRRRRLRAKAYVLAYLASRACMDCGETDPVVLEFDHLREKHATVSALAHSGAKPERLDRELALCEVVCVCCHRRRTAQRRSGVLLSSSPLRRRNVAYVREILADGGCVDCGESDPVVLDFDHVGEKAQNVSRLTSQEVSRERISREIAQCEIRCANCHRRKTAARGEHFRFRSA
jgi:hypothetical protein